jgi:hypothetical protein
MLIWLRDNAYLAAWLAIPVAIVIGVFQNVKLGIEKFDWSRNLLYLAFLVGLAVRFTPFVDEKMRGGRRYSCLHACRLPCSRRDVEPKVTAILTPHIATK